MQTFLDFAARNWLLFAAFLAILVALLVTEFLRLSRGVKAIGVQDALRRLNDETAVLVDVRDPGEFRNGHISGARHLPAGEFDRRIGELDKYRDRELIVCCRFNSARAMDPYQMIQEIGFLGPPAVAEESVADGIDTALSHASEGDLVCVTGSLYVVAEAREHILGESVIRR